MIIICYLSVFKRKLLSEILGGDVLAFDVLQMVQTVYDLCDSHLAQWLQEWQLLHKLN